MAKSRLLSPIIVADQKELRDLVLDAEQHADRAETAADVAALNAGVYVDTAAGLAATSEGDYFSVPSAEDDEYLILYLHDTGGVATEIKRYPSKRYIDGFFEIDESVFEDYVLGKVVSINSSSVNSLAGYAHTDYIAVQEGDVITVPYGAIDSLAAYYNEEKTWTGGFKGFASVVPFSFTIPENVHFIRINIRLSFTPIEEYWVLKSWRRHAEPGSAVSLKNGFVPKGQIEGYMPEPVNLFDIANMSTTTLVRRTNGSFGANTSYPHVGNTGFIPVKPNTTYRTSWSDVTDWVAEYTDNGVFVSGYTGRASDMFTTSPTTHYVVANMLIDDADVYELIQVDPPFESLLWLEPRLKALSQGMLSGRFAGKNLLVTGDSITDSNNSHTTVWWHGFLKEWLGFATVQNDGKSGTGLIKTGTGGVAGINYRLANWGGLYSEPDVILIMGNMNDGTSSTSGAWSWIYGTDDAHKGDFATEVTEENMADSLWFALRYLFEELLRQYPNVPIGFIVSQPRGQIAVKSGTARPGYSTKCWGMDGWFAEWCDVIETITAHYSVPVLNLYKESGLRPWVDANNEEFFSQEDRVHPNLKGHRLMAERIVPFVLQYL